MVFNAKDGGTARSLYDYIYHSNGRNMVERTAQHNSVLSALQNLGYKTVSTLTAQ